MSKLINRWPYNWLSVYNILEDRDDYITLGQVTDRANYSDEAKTAILNYLVKCPIYYVTSCIDITCVKCGMYLIESGNWYYNKEWLWNMNIHHYIGHHAILLPPRFLASIVNDNYQPPGYEDVDRDRIDAIYKGMTQYRKSIQ